MIFRNKSILKFSDKSLLLFEVAILPASLNTLSQTDELAGIERYFFADCANSGSRLQLLFQYIRGSSPLLKM